MQSILVVLRLLLGIFHKLCSRISFFTFDSTITERINFRGYKSSCSTNKETKNRFLDNISTNILFEIVHLGKFDFFFQIMDPLKLKPLLFLSTYRNFSLNQNFSLNFEYFSNRFIFNNLKIFSPYAVQSNNMH